MTRPGRSQNRRQKREWPLASAPTCRSSATSNAKVQLRSSAELKASCARRISRSAMAHRSRAASLRRTSQSAVASRAPSVPSASNCKTVARSRVTFFTGRCRSTRTLCLKGHHGESKIQRTYRRSRPRARKRKPCRTRPWLRICSALKHRHPPTGLSRRLSRSIRRSRTLPSGCAARGMRGAASSNVQGRSAQGRISRDFWQNRPLFVAVPDGLRLHRCSRQSRSGQWARPTSILLPANRIELITRVICAIDRYVGAVCKKRVSSCLHTNVHERGLNFQLLFRCSRFQHECLQAAFCRFANISCRHFHHLIFTLCLHVIVVPAPSASDGKGQEDQADARIANPHFPPCPLEFASAYRWLQPAKLTDQQRYAISLSEEDRRRTVRLLAGERRHE